MEYSDNTNKINNMPIMNIKFYYNILISVFSIFYVFIISLSPFVMDDFSNKVDFQSLSLTSMLSTARYARGIVWSELIKQFTSNLNKPFWPHFIAVVINVINAFLIIKLAERIFKVKKNYYFESFIFIAFLCNPLNIECLLWITAAYPIFLLCSALIATYFLILYLDMNKIKYFYLFVFFSAMCYFINEQGLIIFPLFIYIVLFYNNNEDNIINLLKSKIMKLIKVSFAWILPYLIYRLILIIIFKNASAVQQYSKNFDIRSILSIYKTIFTDYFSNIFPSIILIAFIIIFILYFLKIFIKKEFKFIYIIKLLYFILFILLLLSPFTLLSGWLQYRFFYISSSIFIICTAIFIYSALKNIKNDIKFFDKKIFMDICLGLIIFYSVVSIVYYSYNNLLGVLDAKKFENNFIICQNKEYAKLPANSTVFLDIDANPDGYKFPINYNVSDYLRVSWVANSLKALGIVNPAINVKLLYGIDIKNKIAKTNIAEWLITKQQLKDISKSKIKINCYTFNGTNLEKVQAKKLFIMDNGKKLFEFKLH